MLHIRTPEPGDWQSLYLSSAILASFECSKGRISMVSMIDAKSVFDGTGVLAVDILSKAEHHLNRDINQPGRLDSPDDTGAVATECSRT